MPESVPHKPRTVEKPWGHETIYAETDRYAGKVLFVAKGRRLSLQYHERKSETMYLLRGHVRMTVGPAADALRDVDLRPGDAIDLPPGPCTASRRSRTPRFWRPPPPSSTT